MHFFEPLQEWAANNAIMLAISVIVLTNIRIYFVARKVHKTPKHALFAILTAPILQFTICVLMAGIISQELNVNVYEPIVKGFTIGVLVQLDLCIVPLHRLIKLNEVFL